MNTQHLRRGVVAAASVALVIGVAGCAAGADHGADPSEPDNGSELTMWVRSASGDYSQRLADAYNASHENQVIVTVIPNDQYLQRIGAAAGSNSLPDILGVDVVNAPNYTSQGILTDITDRVDGLRFVDDLAQAHLQVATVDDVTYAVPHKLDSSVLYYNKDLFAQAGLDPEKPPTSFTEIYDAAKAVRGLGGDVYGFYFAGNCGGCTGYTTFPSAWAAGDQVISEDGKTSEIDSAAFQETFALYKKMFDEDIVPSGAKSEGGATWSAPFLAGKVGITLHGSQLINSFQDIDFEWGVAPLRSPDGAESSTFVGGDVAGISRSSKNPDQAWNFLEWTLEEDAQVEIIAKNGDLPARLDLIDNPYTAEEPRRQLIAEGLVNGHTPATLPYGELFNDANGPWVAGFRGAIFGDDPERALNEAQNEIQAKIDSSY